MEKIRINKALAEAGYCSRRKADALVASGQVKVNGKVVDTLGLRVALQGPEADRIEVCGKILTPPEKPCHLLLHKPVAIVCTAADPEGRPTVLDFVPAAWKNRRLYPAGRLDFFSEGLLLLTDDGDLTYRLTHPSRKSGLHLERKYHVLIRGTVPEKALQIMRSGMTLQEGDKVAPIDVRVLKESRYLELNKKIQANATPLFRSHDNTILELTLRQGLNRQIRRMCHDLDLTILRLMRVAQGPLTLGTMTAGEIRSLTPEELKNLQKAVGS